MATIERIFLGFERPFLDHVAERWCAALGPADDPSRTLFVLPGARAARELEARLARRLDLSRPPPRVITEGRLAEALSRVTLRLASPLERTLAWRDVLADLAPSERNVLWRGSGPVPEAHGAPGGGPLARAAARAFAELAGHAFEPDEVAAHLERAGRRDAARWRAFARATAAYRERLARGGAVDPADAARHVLDRGLARADVRIELVGCVDLPRSARRLVAALERAARAWVYAPVELDETFDEFGGLVLDAWAERDVPLATERWRVARGPDDQARIVVLELAELAPRFAPHEVALGVLDREIRPFLERRLAEAGVDSRWAAGRPFATTALARFLGLVERFVADRRFEDFRALLVHPDVEAALERDLGGSLSALADTLDSYAAACVPARLAEGFAPGAEQSDELARARDALFALLGEFGRDARLSLAAWADELARLVAEVCDEVDLGAEDPSGWDRARAFAAFAELLEELRDTAVAGHVCDAREALALVAERTAAVELPPPPRIGARPTLDLQGWLELPLDAAPVAFVAGFDEGNVPRPASESAWLPERLRSELGLGSARARVARDVWIATVLAETRTTWWVSSKKSLSGDPRTPSRLVFRAERDVVVERLGRAFVDEAETATPAAATALDFVLARAPTPKLERVRVTAFRTYLRSPYRFYLEHVLGLSTVAPRVLELDALRFGVLAHDVLQAFGESELARSRDADAIAGFLDDRLRRAVAHSLDPARHAAVHLQVEQLAARLRRFAAWQARTVTEGWTIEHVEWSPREPVRIETPRGSLRLSGRIDRIDRHAASGRWRVLDYKTSDGGKKPSQTHRRGGEWIDLQLPLYRHLARELVGDAPLALGYVALDAGKDEDLEALADWKPEDLARADFVAHEVVEKVLAGVFDEVGDDEPDEPIFAALCGFGLAAASDRADAEGDA
ncbi:MAG: PD-(D/E)XK nuclease family protein [Planctomycetes bacterium]|nr:PD-(D/E)XK nuclease family protein [Planctomycetota bacterium]